MKLNLIMPMAGGGTRFENHGFTLPKPLIRLHGEPFFYWAVQSVVKYIEVESITFVVLKEHVKKYEMDKRIQEYYPNSHITVIPHVLNGAVLTCMEGIKGILNEGSVLFNDCDHVFLCKDFNEFAGGGCGEDIEGALLTFPSNDSRYSFVKFDRDGKVCGTIEKEVVSYEAICGAYYFRNRAVFCDAANTYLSNCKYSEYYVSGLYNEMAKKNMQIRTFKTDTHISFGTPEEFDEVVNQKALFEPFRGLRDNSVYSL